jgi:predicted RNA binding protein YcfA (HicA-like mRNA interferase family)
MQGGEDTMTKYDKLYAKIVNNPKNVTFEELDKILHKQGFKRSNPSSGSSHYTYRHPELTNILTIPYKRPIKAIYVKQALAIIEQLEERN